MRRPVPPDRLPKLRNLALPRSSDKTSSMLFCLVTILPKRSSGVNTPTLPTRLRAAEFIANHAISSPQVQKETTNTTKRTKNKLQNEKTERSRNTPIDRYHGQCISSFPQSLCTNLQEILGKRWVVIERPDTSAKLRNTDSPTGEQQEQQRRQPSAKNTPLGSARHSCLIEVEGRRGRSHGNERRSTEAPLVSELERRLLVLSPVV